MIIFRCDKCHKELQRKELVRLAIELPLDPSQYAFHHQKNLDMCIDCFAALGIETIGGKFEKVEKSGEIGH